ncbi:hypothetical protein DERP_007694, partial [Dermatophagoides pteronyssinus]
MEIYHIYIFCNKFSTISLDRASIIVVAEFGKGVLSYLFMFIFTIIHLRHSDFHDYKK